MSANDDDDIRGKRKGESMEEYLKYILEDERKKDEAMKKIHNSPENVKKRNLEREQKEEKSKNKRRKLKQEKDDARYKQKQITENEIELLGGHQDIQLILDAWGGDWRRIKHTKWEEKSHHNKLNLIQHEFTDPFFRALSEAIYAGRVHQFQWRTIQGIKKYEAKFVAFINDFAREEPAVWDKIVKISKKRVMYKGKSKSMAFQIIVNAAKALVGLQTKNASKLKKWKIFAKKAF